MRNYEKYALIKFTFIYFFSIAFFIILLGYLYYKQQENIILQKYKTEMHYYKMDLVRSSYTYTQDGYSYLLLKKNTSQLNSIKENSNAYEIIFPMEKGKRFIKIILKSTKIDNELYDIKKSLILIQVFLLILFLFISFYLAKFSLKPMKDVISHLDRFLKDLIHDLNTPTTAILLNANMMKKQVTEEAHQKKLNRIENSANSILSLYENLEIVLNEKLFKSSINLYPILEEEKELFNYRFPEVQINIEKRDMFVLTNEKAILRILDNIFSNACKYSKENALINVEFKNNKLIISDNGKGMKYPDKIFERSYHEDENGHGIGMHIVQRLCDNLEILIQIDSKQNIGTTIVLDFNY